MLELGDAKLEVIPVLARHEAELVEDVVQPVAGALGEPKRVASPARRCALEQRTGLVDAQADEREHSLERLAPLWPGVITVVHSASSFRPCGGAPAWRPGPPP